MCEAKDEHIDLLEQQSEEPTLQPQGYIISGIRRGTSDSSKSTAVVERTDLDDYKPEEMSLLEANAITMVQVTLRSLKKDLLKKEDDGLKRLAETISEIADNLNKNTKSVEATKQKLDELAEVLSQKIESLQITDSLPSSLACLFSAQKRTERKKIIENLKEAEELTEIRDRILRIREIFDLKEF